jgi:hypothetical protein
MSVGAQLEASSPVVGAGDSVDEARNRGSHALASGRKLVLAVDTGLHPMSAFGEMVRRSPLVEVDLHIKVAWLGNTESSRLALASGSHTERV